MVTIHNGMLHLNGNLLAAVDFETTGKQAGFHEPIQIAVVPLNADLRPLETVKPFYTHIKPLHPERADRRAAGVHGLSIEQLVLHAPGPDRVADLLIEWFQKLDLPFKKSLVPLAHNWAFESSFLKAWLGCDLMEDIFFGHPRDTMIYALSLNDKAAFKGEEVPFPKVGLRHLCKRFNITNENPHDAFADCIAEAEVYRAMLHHELF